MMFIASALGLFSRALLEVIPWPTAPCHVTYDLCCWVQLFPPDARLDLLTRPQTASHSLGVCSHRTVKAELPFGDEFAFIVCVCTHAAICKLRLIFIIIYS